MANRPIDLKVVAAAGALFLGVGFSAPAFASLIGDSVNATMTYQGQTWDFFSQTLGGHATATVIDPGVEFVTANGAFMPTYVDTFYEADLSGSALTLRWTINNYVGSLGMSTLDFHFFDMDWVGDPTGVITGVTQTSNSFFTCTNTTGSFCNSAAQTLGIAFGDHDMTITVPNVHYRNFVEGQDTVMEATFDIHGSQSVPEPSILGLLGFGLLSLSYMRRRREAHHTC